MLARKKEDLVITESRVQEMQDSQIQFLFKINLFTSKTD